MPQPLMIALKRQSFPSETSYYLPESMAQAGSEIDRTQWRQPQSTPFASPKLCSIRTKMQQTLPISFLNKDIVRPHPANRPQIRHRKGPRKASSKHPGAKPVTTAMADEHH